MLHITNYNIFKISQYVGQTHLPSYSSSVLPNLLHLEPEESAG